MPEVRLTAPQARVLTYLYRCGWASPRATAFAVYDTRKKAYVARRVIDALRDKGLVQPYLRTAWTLTDEGRALARARIESEAP